jgi:hypothetical protein
VLSLFDLEPADYRSHALHDAARAYPETNCYADVLIELVHARGDEPLAMLGGTVRTDFEGDQWTFFKPAPADVERLYGIDIHEMQPYRPLPDQIADQLAAGRTVILELDAWYLPDTRATSYRAEHVKSSAAIEAIDPKAERLRYFHALGLHELEGEDYRGALRLDVRDDSSLPPYMELVRFDAGEPLRGGELRAAALELLREHLAHSPAPNPFDRFAASLREHLPRLLVGDHASYHAYAFATVRMAGSAFEACASHVRWLFGREGEEAARQLDGIVAGSKTLSFKLARRRPFDVDAACAPLADGWAAALAGLTGLAG